MIVLHNPYLLKEKKNSHEDWGRLWSISYFIFIFVKETVCIDENEQDNRCERCERMSTTEKVAGETKIKI